MVTYRAVANVLGYEVVNPQAQGARRLRSDKNTGTSITENLVSPLGIEPRTNRLRVCCSTN